jgi:hypothetical protein
MLDVSRNMVRRYLRGEGLPRYEREARPSKLAPYKHYIDERVKAGRQTGFRRPCCCASCERSAAGGYSILRALAARAGHRSGVALPE